MPCILCMLCRHVSLLQPYNEWSPVFSVIEYLYNIPVPVNILFIFYRKLNIQLLEMGYQTVQHTFDIWHMIKVCIQMQTVCRLVEIPYYLFIGSDQGSPLRFQAEVQRNIGQIQSVSNAMWWAFSRCNGKLVITVVTYTFSHTKFNLT